MILNGYYHFCTRRLPERVSQKCHHRYLTSLNQCLSLALPFLVKPPTALALSLARPNLLPPTPVHRHLFPTTATRYPCLPSRKPRRRPRCNLSPLTLQSPHLRCCRSPKLWRPPPSTPCTHSSRPQGRATHSQEQAPWHAHSPEVRKFSWLYRKWHNIHNIFRTNICT